MYNNILKIPDNRSWAKKITAKRLSGGHSNKISSFRKVKRGVKLGFSN